MALTSRPIPEAVLVQGELRAHEQLVALYPGTFDPLHNGHLDLIQRACRLFDRLIVAVYDMPDKRLLFNTDEREQLIRESVAGLPQVEVASYSTLTVEYAVARGAKALIRGLRATTDFDFEFQVALMNRHLNPNIEALFVMTAHEHAHLSSTLVKEVARLGGQIDGFVPAPVARALIQKLRQPG
jgi:pantetheine-phosphate adenylyltransferase